LITNDTNLVTQGTILVYDFLSPTDIQSTDNAAFKVRVSTTTDQSAIIAGVAQKSITSGDRALILVRGKGKLKSSVAVTSQDRFWISGTAGKATNVPPLGGLNTPQAASRDKQIAWALKTEASSATTDAFITVV